MSWQETQKGTIPSVCFKNHDETRRRLLIRQPQDYANTTHIRQARGIASKSNGLANILETAISQGPHNTSHITAKWGQENQFEAAKEHDESIPTVPPNSLPPNRFLYLRCIYIPSDTSPCINTRPVHRPKNRARSLKLRVSFRKTKNTTSRWYGHQLSGQSEQSGLDELLGTTGSATSLVVRWSRLQNRVLGPAGASSPCVP